MAAYNSGAGTVQHAVERTGYADFWELYKRGVLPQETRNYVPIILAVTIIAKNPEQYGLERVRSRACPADRPGHHRYPVDLRLVAECVDTSVDYLQELNPSLLRMTTPKDETVHPESCLRLARKVRDRHCRHPAGHADLLALSPCGLRRHAAVDRAQVSHLRLRPSRRPTTLPKTI